MRYEDTVSLHLRDIFLEKRIRLTCLVGAIKQPIYLKTRWWEGPIWMENCIDEWPCTTKYFNIDEEEINRERKSRGDNVPNPSDLKDISKGNLSLDQMKDIGVPNITRTGRHVKIPEKLNL
ncbi:hypothetical protein CEXT_202801 [Caerostris extrusa]|uniref:Uncharacterized protein n=1 Tax=Caerostris extrusa TaxID=172846 RepID=A0AAV4TMB8_CAEEX|nr:hypothetical protein CEXT_202801 [Caerostris extrusa]